MLTWQKENPSGDQREIICAYDDNGWHVGDVIQFREKVSWVAIVGNGHRRAISQEAAIALVEAQFAQKGGE